MDTIHEEGYNELVGVVLKGNTVPSGGIDMEFDRLMGGDKGRGIKSYPLISPRPCPTTIEMDTIIDDVGLLFKAFVEDGEHFDALEEGEVPTDQRWPRRDYR